MLQTKTVESNTFALLKELMELDFLTEFSLVGGTALSLKYGHRISVDLDLFSENDFNNSDIIDGLKKYYKSNFSLEGNIEKFGIFCYLNGVKVDIVKHKYPLIANVETIDSIRMYSSIDICAMKVNAILGRGKKKDFFDIVELLKHYKIAEIIEFYEMKFSEQRLLISIPQAITYFEDADNSEDPVSLNNQTWEDVKTTICRAVNDYLK